MKSFGFLPLVVSVAFVAGCAASSSARSGGDGPSTVTEHLEVTPGLRTQDVSKALEPVRARLRDCIRLTVLGNGPGVRELRDGQDDRVLIPFRILSEGKVSAESTRIRSVYLDEHCVEDLLESLEFEPLLVRDVSVTWTTTFSTTATERGARRTELARSYARMCEALSEGLPPGGAPPLEGYEERSRQRLRALIPSLDPMVQRAAEAVASVNLADRWTLFRASAEEYGLEARCPALEALVGP
ncbi:hypothetical protein NR798_00165 [Archangium gephyra]|uniref:hypothetical protein n=1 Tax=Archangium gephyra TaxID=48 RepID=UPI0035D41A56